MSEKKGLNKNKAGSLLAIMTIAMLLCAVFAGAQASASTTPQPVRWTWKQCPTSAQVGDSYQYSIKFEVQSTNGNWYPAKNTGISFIFTNPNGVNKILKTSTPSDTTGIASVSFSPDIAGSWKVKCDWDHNNQIYSWESSAIKSITVSSSNKQDTSISLSGSSSIVLGSAKTITGTLKTTSGSVIGGATVSVQITNPDGSQSSKISRTTDSKGAFTYTTTPSTAGSYTITVVYSGSTAYDAASKSISFVVSEPTTTTKIAYDYIVSGTKVKNPSGTVVYSKYTFSQALSWALSQSGKRVYVPSGTYSCSSLYLKNGVTLIGDGPGTTGTVLKTSGTLVLKGVSDVNIQGIRIIGGGNIEISSLVNGKTMGDIMLKDVTIIGSSKSHSAAFSVYCRDNSNIVNLQFIRCTADGGDGIGFGILGQALSVLDGVRNTAKMRALNIWVKNVYLEDCKALNCGMKSTRFNTYVCGYNLAENTNVDNIKLVRCQATNNWMNGFHWENTCHVYDVHCYDCVANNNGWATQSNAKNVGYKFSLAVAFGESSQVTLHNCMGKGNNGGDVWDGVTPFYNLPPTG